MTEVEECWRISGNPSPDIEVGGADSFELAGKAESAPSLTDPEAQAVRRRSERVVAGSAGDVLIPTENLVEEKHLTQADLRGSVLLEPGIVRQIGNRGDGETYAKGENRKEGQAVHFFQIFR